MGIIIYCILLVKRDTEKLNSLLNDIKGISNTDLFAISSNEIAVVVSDIEKHGLTADRSNTLKYASVVEQIFQQFALLPMRFGSVIESREMVTKLLERNYIEILQNLYKVESKYEFGLKVFCDSGKLKEELIEKSSDNIQAPVKTVPEIKRSVFRDYVDKKLREHKLEELMLAYVDQVISKITTYLSMFNSVNKFRKMVTETTILDAIFLIDKDHKSAIIHAVDDLQGQYPTLNFILTGPWPPYNFVEITLK